MKIRAKRSENIHTEGIDTFAFDVSGSTVTKYRLVPEDQTGALGDDSAAVTECATLSLEDAQLLADDLWDAGIRPTKRADASELLKAKDAHISDLREVAMAALRQSG